MGGASQHLKLHLFPYQRRGNVWEDLLTHWAVPDGGQVHD